MVEQWSSKSYARVRILLPLFVKNAKSLAFQKTSSFKSLKNKINFIASKLPLNKLKIRSRRKGKPFFSFKSTLKFLSSYTPVLSPKKSKKSNIRVSSKDFFFDKKFSQDSSVFIKVSKNSFSKSKHPFLPFFINLNKAIFLKIFKNFSFSNFLIPAFSPFSVHGDLNFFFFSPYRRLSGCLFFWKFFSSSFNSNHTTPFFLKNLILFFNRHNLSFNSFLFFKKFEGSSFFSRNFSHKFSSFFSSSRLKVLTFGKEASVTSPATLCCPSVAPSSTPLQPFAKKINFWESLFLLKKGTKSKFFSAYGRKISVKPSKRFLRKLIRTNSIRYLELCNFLNSSLFLTKYATSNFFLIDKLDYSNNLLIRVSARSKNFQEFDLLNLPLRGSFIPLKYSLKDKVSTRLSFKKLNFLAAVSFFDDSLLLKRKNYFFLKKKENFLFSRLKKTYLNINTHQTSPKKKFLKKNKFALLSRFEIPNSKDNKFPVLKKFQTPFKFCDLNSFLCFSKLETLLFIFSSPLFFKQIFRQIKLNLFDSKLSVFDNYLSSYYSFGAKSLFQKNILFKTNLFPLKTSFLFEFKKYLIQSFNYRKFPSSLTPFYYQTIVKFLEFCSGRKVYFKTSSFLMKSLDLDEQAKCLMWSHRIKSFRRVLGPRLFLNESLQIVLICLKLKDPFMLSNWMLSMLYKISFWKYKMFFRYMQYILRYFFWPMFTSIKIKGLKFQLKGKVSVAGNARTRTVMNKIGVTGHSTFNNRVLTNLNFLKTFTGVIGFRTWLIF